MKLKFTKNDIGEISVEVLGKEFSPKDYIEMIKEIMDKKKIEAEFTDNISAEEQNSVNSMLKEINNIKNKEINTDTEDCLEEDIPF